MTIPTISTLPTAPARTDAPATFISRADAFLAALVTMQSELNTTIGAMNTDIGGIAANVTAAQAAQTAAELAETNAEAAQAAAEAASNATLWVSGTSYSAGDVVYSPVDYKSYRANTATSGTTDPSASADWTKLTYALPSQTGNAGFYLTTDGTNESWAAVAAGSGTITATASGAITAADPVVVNSDSTVSTLSATGDVGAILATSFGGNIGQTCATETIVYSYDSSNERLVLWATGSNNSLYAIQINLTSTSTASSGSTAISGYGWYADNPPAVFYSSVSNYHYAIKPDSVSGPLIYIPAQTSTAVSLGTVGTFNSTNTHFRVGVIEGPSNTFLIYADEGTNAKTYAQAVQPTTSTLSPGSAVDVDSVYMNRSYAGCYHAAEDKYVIGIASNSHSPDSSKYYVTSVTGTTVSAFSAGASISSGAKYIIDMIYHPTTQKIVFLLHDSTDNGIVVVSGSLSGTTITFDSEIKLDNSLYRNLWTANNLREGMSLSYDSDNDLIVINLRNAAIGYNEFQISFNFVGSTLTFIKGVQIISSSIVFGNAKYSPSLGYIINCGSNTVGNGGAWYVYPWTVDTFQTNVEINSGISNYIGFAESSVSDGQEVSIKTNGNTQDGFTGLTPARKYYLQGDASISLTDDVDIDSAIAGKSISSTTILIDSGDI